MLVLSREHGSNSWESFLLHSPSSPLGSIPLPDGCHFWKIPSGNSAIYSAHLDVNIWFFGDRTMLPLADLGRMFDRCAVKCDAHQSLLSPCRHLWATSTCQYLPSFFHAWIQWCDHWHTSSKVEKKKKCSCPMLKCKICFRWFWDPILKFVQK